MAVCTSINKLRILHVIQKGECYAFTAPHFTVVTEDLLHVVIQEVTDDQEGEQLEVFDAFVRVLKKPLCICIIINPPCSLQVISDCYVTVKDFSSQISLKNMNMNIGKEGVLVVWDYRMHELEEESLIEDKSDDPGSDHSDENLSSTTTSENYSLVRGTHTVIFKCIFKCMDSVKESASQMTLRTARDKLSVGWTLPVRMRPEPDNIFESRAIVFECKANDKWEKIGYVVKDILDEVHTAIDTNQILAVEFQWIKFVTDWNFSG